MTIDCFIALGMACIAVFACYASYHSQKLLRRAHDEVRYLCKIILDKQSRIIELEQDAGQAAGTDSQPGERYVTEINNQ